VLAVPLKRSFRTKKFSSNGFSRRDIGMTRTFDFFPKGPPLPRMRIVPA
jgi:hypothetical protein